MTFLCSYNCVSVLFSSFVLTSGEMCLYGCTLCHTRGTFAEVIVHASRAHPNYELKLTKTILDEATGNRLLQTLSFGIIPGQLPPGHFIEPNENCDELLIIEATPDSAASRSHRPTTDEDEDKFIRHTCSKLH